MKQPLVATRLAFGLMICGWLIGSPIAHGQQSGSSLGGLAQGPAPAAQERAAALRSEAERLARESRTLLGELRKLEIERELQNDRARQAATAMEEATQALAQSEARLADVEAQRAAQLPDIRVRLVDLYKRGRSGNLRLLLGATSLREFARTTRAIASMARLTETRLGDHRRLLVIAQAERAAAAEALRRVQAESQKAEQGRAAANAAVQARSALLADIDSRRDLTAQLAGELEVAAKKLDEQVASVASASAAPTSATPAPVLRIPVRGALEWPVDGRVIGRFGERSSRTGGNVIRNGIELESPEGTAARAIHPGSVVFAAPLQGFGTLVIVDHTRGYHSVYGYLASASVARGDTVEVGREIGRIGATPGGPAALYFEFRIDGRSVDPLQWLRPR